MTGMKIDTLAIAATGEKFGGCGSTRVSAASTIRAASTSGPGAKIEEATGRFISVWEQAGRSR